MQEGRRGEGNKREERVVGKAAGDECFFIPGERTGLADVQSWPEVGLARVRWEQKAVAKDTRFCRAFYNVERRHVGIYIN